MPDKVVAAVVHVPRLRLSASDDAAPVTGAIAIKRLVCLLVPLEVLHGGKSLVAAYFVAEVLFDVVPFVFAGSCPSVNCSHHVL